MVGVIKQDVLARVSAPVVTVSNLVVRSVLALLVAVHSLVEVIPVVFLVTVIKSATLIRHAVMGIVIRQTPQT